MVRHYNAHMQALKLFLCKKCAYNLLSQSVDCFGLIKKH